MKPAAFAYHRPATVAEAVSTLARYGGDARSLAGGQSLVPLMNLRMAQPAALIDLAGCAGLTTLAVEAGELRIGAMVRQREAERSDAVRRAIPLLSLALPHVGPVPTRNRGTIGGTIAHADPAAELPAVALALEAEMVATGPAGERRIAAAAFFLGELTTALAGDELLTEIRFPVPPEGTTAAFVESGAHHSGLALAGVAALLTRGGDGRIRRVRLAAFGAAERPVRLVGAERMLADQVLRPELARAAAAAVAADIDPLPSLHASAEYRGKLVVALVERALADAAGRGGMA